jgi:hypothetical protein
MHAFNTVFSNRIERRRRSLAELAPWQWLDFLVLIAVLLTCVELIRYVPNREKNKEEDGT